MEMQYVSCEVRTGYIPEDGIVRSHHREKLILIALMVEATCSPETSVLSRATRRNISEDGILHGHRRENLKSFISYSTAINILS
jgi:hypothetical protein